MNTLPASKTFPKPWGSKWERFFVAFFAGSLIFYLGHKILHVQLELFWGIAGYNLAWVTAMFVLPVLTGIVVGMIYGWGGKWLAHFPPLVVAGVSYYVTSETGIPDGASLIPIMWWGFFVLLNMEFSAAGGVIGELLLKYWYGSLDMPGTADYAPVDAEHLPEDE